MLLNNIKDNRIPNAGNIYFENESSTIKLGTFSFDQKYNHFEMRLGEIRIAYEYTSKPVYGGLPHMYWIDVYDSISRYHGRPSRDDEWVFELLEEVSPFKAEINELLKQFITAACDKAMSL